MKKVIKSFADKKKKVYDMLKPYVPPILLDKLANMVYFINFLKYKKILSKNKKYKGVFHNKRCFILGSGPSIKSQNLKLLKNENLIALNNFYVHPDFKDIMSGKGSKFYAFSALEKTLSEKGWVKWINDMDNKIPKKVKFFFGLNRNKINAMDTINKFNLCKNRDINYYYTGIISNQFSKMRKGDVNIIHRILGSSNGGLHSLLLVIFMGFSEIYLLGFDHDWFCKTGPEKYHFFKNYFKDKGVNTYFRDPSEYLHENMFLRLSNSLKTYREIKENFPEITIINLSPTSLIDVFEKKNYGEVMRKLKNKK